MTVKIISVMNACVRFVTGLRYATNIILYMYSPKQPGISASYFIWGCKLQIGNGTSSVLVTQRQCRDVGPTSLTCPPWSPYQLHEATCVKGPCEIWAGTERNRRNPAAPGVLGKLPWQWGGNTCPWSVLACHSTSPEVSDTKEGCVPVMIPQPASWTQVPPGSRAGTPGSQNQQF